MTTAGAEFDGKIPASWLASLVATGWFAYLAYCAVGLSITGEKFVDFAIYFVICLNILFFYCYEAYTETCEKEQGKLSEANLIEWWLRVVNQLWLIAMWEVIKFDMVVFLLMFVGYNAIIIVWDAVVYLPRIIRKNEAPPVVVWYDTIAFVLSIAFVSTVIGVKATNNLNHDFMLTKDVVQFYTQNFDKNTLPMLTGLLVATYLGLLWFAWRRLRMNPFRMIFDKRYVA